MKKFLEMIAVILLVFGVIGAGVFLFQKHGNGLQGAPTNLEQEASSTMMIVGGP